MDYAEERIIYLICLNIISLLIIVFQNFDLGVYKGLLIFGSMLFVGFKMVSVQSDYLESKGGSAAYLEYLLGLGYMCSVWRVLLAILFSMFSLLFFIVACKIESNI
jgi:hypothetical protein